MSSSATSTAGSFQRDWSDYTRNALTQPSRADKELAHTFWLLGRIATFQQIQAPVPPSRAALLVARLKNTGEDKS